MKTNSLNNLLVIFFSTVFLLEEHTASASLPAKTAKNKKVSSYAIYNTALERKSPFFKNQKSTDTSRNAHHKILAKPIKEKDAIVYHLYIDYKTVNFTGKNVKAMLVNDSFPAPTLFFKEGKKALIYVTNKMDVDTSIHWHGILLPNFQDGVPYLTTPPILPGKTHKFEFTLKQSGTYWYHSHTGLQEQRGVYGAIVVEPKRKKHSYKHDLVLVLSDWTNENPNEVLRTLKRGSEWYAIKKGSALSLSQVIARNALNAQLAMWRNRMPGMDISDVYYDVFLMNGKNTQHYPNFKAGEKIRLRIVNAAASTYFHLSFGGPPPSLISADGLNIKPFPVKKILHAIAETYDFLMTVPKGKSIEITATAQDGSGSASVIIGKGDLLKAPLISKPDPARQMREMADMHSGGHHNNMKGHTMSQTQQAHSMHEKHKGHAVSQAQQAHLMHKKHKSHAVSQAQQTHPRDKKHKGHTISQAQQMHPMHEKHKGHTMSQKQIKTTTNYDDLRSIEKTSFSNKNTLREIHLNLTGNMWRYVWSMNGKTLSNVDIIKIKKKETTRIYLHNTTMMHHPMHLHGHFFRVLNKHGEYSPLKHTVDVSPMQTAVIEFEPTDEEGDWFFHCHVLYHMKSGMSRIFRYGDKRDPRLKDFPLSTVLNADKKWYKWAELSMMSNRFDLSLVASNTKNKMEMEGVFSWVNDYYELQENLEVEIAYEYFITDFFRFYGGAEVENTEGEPIESMQDLEIVGKAGFRYLLPYFFELEMNLNHRLQLQIGLEYELLLFPRTELAAEWEWTMDFGITNPLPEGKTWTQEQEWSVGFNYILSKNFSITTSYHNHFSWGAGINWKL